MSKKNNQGKSNARLIDESLLIQAGINPKTLLPMRSSALACDMLAGIKMALRVRDEQDAVNRYVWYNLPGEITGQELERLIYYRFQLCFFYFKETKKFYFMPYTLNGTIDFYGRYNTVSPVPISSSQENEAKKEKKDKSDDEKIYEARAKILSDKKLRVLYDVPVDEVLDKSAVCVLLHDYTKQLNIQSGQPRAVLQDPIVSLESEILPMARTAILASTGTRGVRVQNPEESASILSASNQMYSAAMSGKLMIPVNGAIDFQDLPNRSTANCSDYLEVMQAIDNFRLSMYGIENGGIFQKKAHKLESEQEANAAPCSSVSADGTAIRQNFCNIANKVYGLSIWCEPADRTDSWSAAAEEQNGDQQGEQDQGGESNA